MVNMYQSNNDGNIIQVSTLIERDDNMFHIIIVGWF